MSEPDALSSLLGERAERQHREMMRATIAASIIGNAACMTKPPNIDTAQYIDYVCTGAWAIADTALKVRDEMIKQGKITP